MAGRARRGFAVMNRDKQREIARMGGRAAHRKGAAHEFTSEEARAAGRKGGATVSRNREHMSRIGRNGGLSSRAGRGVIGTPPAAEAPGDSEEQAGQTEQSPRQPDR
jgi:general stress protein YciG